MHAMSAIGSNFRLRMRPESTPGTLATGNYDQIPCFTFDLSPRQELTQDAILSSTTNRDSADPYYGLVRVQGQAVVPLDTVHIGRWLRLLLGAPTTTGSSPNFIHTYQSGSATLPYNSVEKAYTDITRFERVAGVRAGSMSLNLTPDGSAQATVSLMGLAETTAATTGAGTPVVTAFNRFFNVQGSISRGGTNLGLVTSAEFEFSNNMEMLSTIRNDFRMEDIEEGLASASGAITMRFADHTIYDAAAAGAAPAALVIAWTIDVNTSITFTFGRTFLTKDGAPIEGPRGISQRFRFIAGPHATTGVMQTVLRNAVASYATS